MRGSFRRLFMSVAALAVFFIFTLSDLSVVRADETVLSDQAAELLFTQEWASGDSIIQSVCATDDYIITIENTAKKEIAPDIVTAYYKNDTDAAGNPVEKYSVAMQVQDQDWEHGNCMTYNPNTGYVYVALYTNFNSDLRGCIHVMDPTNLSLIGTQKVTDDFNLLSIAYDEKNNVYYGQADGDGSYSIFVMDTDFHIIEDLGPADPTPGYNFQGFCKSGDYLVQSPLTVNLGVGNYMMAYYIPERSFVDVVGFDYNREGATKIEPEQIAPMGDGSFVTVVNNSYNDEYGCGDIYRVVFPHLSAVTEITPEVTPEPVTPVPTIDEEVRITTEREQMTSVETEASEETEQQENNTPPGKPFNPVPVIVIIVIAAGAVIGIRMFRIRLERQRRARDARAKRRRKMLMEELEREIDELDI